MAECSLEYDRVAAQLKVLSDEQEQVSEGVEEGVADGTLSVDDAKQKLAELNDIKSRRAAMNDELERMRDRLEAIGQELAAKKTG